MYEELTENRHWKESQYQEVEILANLLFNATYAIRKMTSGYIAPAAGGLNVLVAPYDNTLEGRQQQDAIINLLYYNYPHLQDEYKYHHPAAMITHQTRNNFIKWCVNNIKVDP